MKTFNLVACIIVLLLALISAACSYFLYEKRVQFVDGWNQMSTAINTSAKTIDSRGNKKFATKLTPDTLSHKNYASLGSQLKNLTDQSTEFIKQYDELTAERDSLAQSLKKTQEELARVKNQCQQMAATFAAISARIGANAGTAANLADINIYSSRIKMIKEKVDQLFNSRENIASELQSIAKREGFTIDKQRLFTSPRSGLAPVTSKIAEHKNARRNYANALRSIAGLVKVQFTDNGQMPAALNNGVRALNSKLNSTQSQLSSSIRQVGSLKANVTQLNTTIKNLNNVIDDRNRALDLPISEREPKVWKRGSVEARSALIGKVSKVSDEYGYIVIDFGTATTVKQIIGNKELFINPDLESGLAFSVVRDDEFIAEITLNNVSAKESTANIPTAKNAPEIKVGDSVILKK